MSRQSQRRWDLIRRSARPTSTLLGSRTKSRGRPHVPCRFAYRVLPARESRPTLGISPSALISMSSRSASPEVRAQTERRDAGRFRDSGKESERARRARPENPDAMARNRGASKTRCRATNDRFLITTSCPKRLRGAHASSDAGSHPAPDPHLDSWFVGISTIASFSVGRSRLSPQLA
jgi:hypothetical protein